MPRTDHQPQISHREPRDAGQGDDTSVFGHLQETVTLSGGRYGQLRRDFGRYRILKKLGGGGMGDVYLAEDTRLHRHVALKTPSTSEGFDERLIRRFFREARATATIQHPNVCPLFDFGMHDGRYFLTMAYLKGCTLAQWIDDRSEVPAVDALRIVRKLAHGLQAAHEAGVVHRDLKPGNVMMVDEQEPVIIDFGVVRILDTEESLLSVKGSMVGTPAYMAPERILGEPGAGPTTDIYSLGVILYELLTGRLPFLGSLATMSGTIVCDAPPDPTSVCRALDPGLDELCLRALSKQPQQRYPSAAAFAEAIESFLSSGRCP